jgi:hypothetical protein
MTTVLGLITQAFRLSGILARTGNPTPDQQNLGLSLFQDILSLVSTNARLIPYYTTHDLVADQGDAEYFIPGLIEVSTITYLLDNIVRVPLPIVSRQDFFGTARITNLTTIPFQAYIEKTKGGSTLFLYAIPQADYPIQINGKFSLPTAITLETDLDTLLDRFYQIYLRYQLANYICQQSTVSLPPATANELEKLEAKMTDIAPMDLSVKKISVLGNNAPFSWAQLNIGHGWTPQ